MNNKIEELRQKYRLDLNQHGHSKKLFLDDVKFLFDNNLSFKNMQDILNCSGGRLRLFLKKNDLVRTAETTQQIREKTYEEKYGCNVSQLPEIKEKVKQTNMEKYGDWYGRTEEGKQRNINTNLEKYGVDNYAKTQDFKDFMCNNMSKIHSKMNTTMLEKYGDIWGRDPSFIEKRKKTCLEKYGVEYIAQSPEVQEKAKQTNLQKFGTPWPTQCDEIKEKTYNTRKKNKSFNRSNEEDYIFKQLCSKFEVKRQYKSDVYPFYCDFYIPEKDLYIEYQGFWMHRSCPFDNSNDEHLQQIKLWEERSKQKDFKNELHGSYKDAIRVWTVSDPKKRQVAKDNNLNWIEFFSVDEFNDWFNTIC